MSHAWNLSHRAMERAFDALVAACQAAVTAAAAATDERFEPPPPLAPAPDPIHATRQVVRLACQLQDALLEYCVASQLPDLEPDHDQDDDPLDKEAIPF